MKFTIEKVGMLTGLPAVTLRNWEKRYGFPRPERAGSGHRFYKSEDVEFLKQVKEWLSSGHNLSQIGEFYKEIQEKGSQKTQSTQVTQAKDEQGIKFLQKSASTYLIDDVDYRVQLLYENLVNFNSIQALGHYTILNSKLSPDKFFDRVIEVVLGKIEKEWKAEKISLAQETFAFSFLRMRMMSFLCLDLPIAQPHKILAATMVNEKYDGNLLLVSAHLKFRGYPVNYFSSELPCEEFVELLGAVKPNILLLSYVDPRRFLQDIRLIQKLNVVTCVGGAAFSEPQFCLRALKQIPNNVFISTKSVGSEIASFVEMICQSR